MKKIFQCFINVLIPSFCIMEQIYSTLNTGIAASVVCSSAHGGVRHKLYCSGIVCTVMIENVTNVNSCTLLFVAVLIT